MGAKTRARTRTGWSRGLTAVLVMLLVSGCFAPQGPTFGDGHSLPEEASRTPLPVRPGPDGTWALNRPDMQLLGQGRVLARLKSPQAAAWRTTLPDELRLTSPVFGAPHSAMFAGQVWVAGAGAGDRGPSVLAGIDAANGRLLWHRAVTPGSRVFAAEGNVLEVICRTGSCEITAWPGSLGASRWTRTVPGAVRVLDSCGADALNPAAPQPEPCSPYVITRRRVGVLDPEDGGVQWVAGLRPPDGVVDRIARDGDRTVLVTAPAEGTCKATVAASGVGSGEGDRGWRHTFVWDQPQARRDPRSGCRWDRSLPLTLGFRMVLPDAKGALLIHPYFGTLHPHRRLARGAYLTSQQPASEQTLSDAALIRRPGRPDRRLDDSGSDRVRPRGVSSSALFLGSGFWQDGHRLVLLGDEDKKLWSAVSSCQAYAHRGLLSYCDGRDLVTLRPASDD